MRRLPRHAAQSRARAGLFAAGAAIALLSTSAHALSCYGFYAPPEGPLVDPSIHLPVDGQPWFSIACGDSPTCTLYADPERTQLVPSDTFDDGCSTAWIAPWSALTPGATYYTECGDYGSRFFRVRDDSEPAQALTLDALTPRRELSDGCCGDRYLSIDVDLSGGDIPKFFREGGVITVEYADGQTFFRDEAIDDDGLWELPDTDEDITVTLVSANGERQVEMIAAEDFDRDLAYVPCTVNDVNRGIFGLWLLAPLLWIRRRRLDRGARR